MTTTEIKTNKFKDFSNSAKEVLKVEINALEKLYNSFFSYSYNQINFNKTCQLLLDCKGKVILTGIGKSGHIANKIAATLSSLGTPSFFIHPSEALHGDIGMIKSNDIVIAISYSGASDEVTQLVPSIKRLNIPLISITGYKDSILAKNSDAHLLTEISKEACPLGLAPTASTTAALAIGDAIAIALTDAKNFTHEDFALSHPGGSLGKKLLLTISDIMIKNDELPLVNNKTSIKDALLVMTSKRLGLIGITDHENKLIGIFTDGDLRRAFENLENISFNKTSIEKVMNTRFITVQQKILASEAIHILEKNKINGAFVLDNNQNVIGAFNLHTLLQHKII